MLLQSKFLSVFDGHGLLSTLRQTAFGEHESHRESHSQPAQLVADESGGPEGARMRPGVAAKVGALPERGLLQPDASLLDVRQIPQDLIRLHVYDVKREMGLNNLPFTSGSKWECNSASKSKLNVSETQE